LKLSETVAVPLLQDTSSAASGARGNRTMTNGKAGNSTVYRLDDVSLDSPAAVGKLAAAYCIYIALSVSQGSAWTPNFWAYLCMCVYIRMKWMNLMYL